MLIPSTFIVDGSGLESMGFFRVIVDTYGQQALVGPYGLMLRGLAFRIDEQWAPSFTLPVNGWTLSFANPVNGWTIAFATPSNGWTQSFSTPTTSWTGITLPTTTWTDV